MKRLARYGLVFALLAVVGGLGWSWYRRPAVPRVTYKTQPLERRRVAAKLTASGTLQAKVTVQVGAQVSGRIIKLYADFNDKVKKGQLIAKLDPQMFAAAAAQAQASFASAKAAIAKAAAQQKDAELVLLRTQALSAQTLASTADLQTAQTNVEVMKAGTDAARAQLAQATAARNLAQVNLSYTEIASPIDGVIISRNVDVGQTVAASLQAPVLFTIAEDLRSMQVHTSVAEADVGRLEAGMAASFTVDAFSGRRFEGKVAQIRNAAQTVQNVVTYDAVIEANNEELKLRPGMTATVTVVWAEKTDVPAVSNLALRFAPPREANGVPAVVASAQERGPKVSPEVQDAAGKMRGKGKRERRSLWVLRAGRPYEVAVTPGVTDGSFTELVKSDLAIGDRIITEAELDGKPATASTAAPASVMGGAAPPRLGRMF